jgi:hypothetical protein
MEWETFLQTNDEHLRNIYQEFKELVKRQKTPRKDMPSRGVKLKAKRLCSWKVRVILLNGKRQGDSDHASY